MASSVKAEWIVNVFGDELLRSNFADPVMEMDYLTVNYRQPEMIIKDLRQMHMISAEIELPATSLRYEIIYGHAWRSEIQVTDETGVVKIPLSQLRRR